MSLNNRIILLGVLTVTLFTAIVSVFTLAHSECRMQRHSEYWELYPTHFERGANR